MGEAVSSSPHISQDLVNRKGKVDGNILNFKPKMYISE